jgi:hypothetical protein
MAEEFRLVKNHIVYPDRFSNYRNFEGEPE